MNIYSVMGLLIMIVSAVVGISSTPVDLSHTLSAVLYIIGLCISLGGIVKNAIR